MGDLGAGAVVGITVGLIVGTAVNPILGLLVGIAVTFGYARLVGGDEIPDHHGEISNNTLLMWEYAPGRFIQSSMRASGGAAQYIVLGDPDGSFTAAHDTQGNYIAHFRRVGPAEWEAA